MRFTLLVNCGPEQTTAYAHAGKFCSALHRAGHSLVRVFFYGEGTLAARDDSHWRAITVPETERVLCSASAELYGITEAPEGFVIGGLGSLMEAGLDSDRVIQFG